MNQELYYTYNLSQFTVKIFRIVDTNQVVPIEFLQNLTTTLDSYEYPSDIVHTIQSLEGIAKIEIYNRNNEIISRTEILFDNQLK